MSRLYNFLGFFIVSLITVTSAGAFQYASLPSDNLIQNAWFRNASCQYSNANWQTNLWGGGSKTQDPTDVNCNGNWTGFAARWADQNQNGGFTPNTNALLWQVVLANSASKTLHFHSLIVGHRVNQYKAEIYGSSSSNGPWTSVWKVFDISCPVNKDCMNEAPNGVCNTGNRECLWDEVTEYYLGSLSPLTHTILQGYPYYKVEFLLNYPNPDPNLATGDVGGKLARVYFKVSGSSSLSPTPIKTPTKTPTPIKSPTKTPTPSTSKPGDANGDNLVNGADYLIWLQNYGASTSLGPKAGDFNISGKVDGADYLIWLQNYGT